MQDTCNILLNHKQAQLGWNRKFTNLIKQSFYSHLRAAKWINLKAKTVLIQSFITTNQSVYYYTIITFKLYHVMHACRSYKYTIAILLPQSSYMSLLLNSVLPLIYDCTDFDWLRLTCTHVRMHPCSLATLKDLMLTLKKFYIRTEELFFLLAK